MKKYQISYPDGKRELIINADIVLCDKLTAWHINFEVAGKTIAIITEPCTVIEIQ